MKPSVVQKGTSPGDASQSAPVAIDWRKQQKEDSNAE